MLESDPVQMARLNVTKTLCAQATWALCEVVRNMYSAPMTPEDFSSGKRLVFPTSTLANISTNLRHQEEFYRRGFPSQWLYTAAGTLPLVSTTGSQYGGGSFVQHGPSVGGSQPLPICIPIADVDNMSGLTTLAPPAGISPFPSQQSVGTEDSRKIKGLNSETHPIIAAVTMS